MMRAISNEEEKLITPSSTFKYRGFRDQFHLKLLTDREIFFSRTDQINDPFDCKIPIQVNRYSSSEYMIVAQQLAMKVYPNQNAEFIYDWAKDAVCKDLLNDPVHLAKERDSFYKEVKEKYGIFCTSLAWDNIVLWSHYGANHTGFLIGLNNRKLKEELELLSGPVSYESDFPVWDFSARNPPETLIRMLNTKYIDWSYEREYRHTSLKYVGRSVKLSPSCFDSLYLGVNIDRKDKQLAIRKFKEIDQNLPIYQCQLNTSKSFALDRKQIN